MNDTVTIPILSIQEEEGALGKDAHLNARHSPRDSLT